MMQQVGNLRHSSMRQRARRVKLNLDWGVHGRRMQLMGLDDSGKRPICMATDLLEHNTFDCNYSAAVHKRQDRITDIKVMLQHHHRQQQQKPGGWTMQGKKSTLNCKISLSGIRTNRFCGEVYGPHF